MLCFQYQSSKRGDLNDFLDKDEVWTRRTGALVINTSLDPLAMTPGGDDILEPGHLGLHSMTRAPVTKMRSGGFTLT